MERHKAGHNGHQAERHSSQTKVLHGIQAVSDTLTDRVDRVYEGINRFEDGIENIKDDMDRWWRENPTKALAVAFVAGAVSMAWLIGRARGE